MVKCLLAQHVEDLQVQLSAGSNMTALVPMVIQNYGINSHHITHVLGYFSKGACYSGTSLQVGGWVLHTYVPRRDLRGDKMYYHYGN